MKPEYCKREIEERLKAVLDAGDKILILYGARRVGKTTLIRQLIAREGLKTIELSGDDIAVSDALSSRDSVRLLGLTTGYDIAFIDEAQRIPEIGLGLKIIHDALPSLRLIVTGSSSLDLASKTREALTGRTWTWSLFPFSIQELSASKNPFEQERTLERDLVYGLYPEVQTAEADTFRAAYLRELHSSYLFKDVLEIAGIRQPRKIVDLVRLLAWQVGSEVSFSELGSKLGMNKDTVMNYVDLLEKSFIIFRLQPHSRNLRNEVTRSPKIYFCDNGVRNAAINDFRAFSDRNDQGNLWENFIISERRKRIHAANIGIEPRYWRLHTGAEIDYVEERNGQLHGWEIKLSPTKKAHMPASWTEAYPGATWNRVDRSNYRDFITGDIGYGL